MKKRALFICTHNSARSQMAEAFLRMLYGDRYEAYSAGLEPTEINPYIIRAMEEIGVDISKQYSKSLEEFRGERFDYVVTVCDHAKRACPFFPREKIIHRSFEDPTDFKDTEEEKMEKVRFVRDEIKRRIEENFSKSSLESTL